MSSLMFISGHVYWDAVHILYPNVCIYLQIMKASAISHRLSVNFFAPDEIFLLTFRYSKMLIWAFLLFFSFVVCFSFTSVPEILRVLCFCWEHKQGASKDTSSRPCFCPLILWAADISILSSLCLRYAWFSFRISLCISYPCCPHCLPHFTHLVILIFFFFELWLFFFYSFFLNSFVKYFIWVSFFESCWS